MKSISIIMAGLLLATGAMAQHMPVGKNIIGKQPMSKLEKSRQQTLRLMSKPATANKSTASYERMRAMSEYGAQQQGGPIQFFDSLQFNYSGMRGSEFDYNSMSIGYFDPIFGAMTEDNQLSFFPDNFQVYAPNLVANYTLTYDVDDNVTELYMINNGSDDERILMTYNNSKVVYAENLVANGPNWDTTYRRYFNYDMNDMLVEDSVMENVAGVWSIILKYEYTYDVNGNITSLKTSDNDNMSSTFLPYEEVDYTYNTNDQIETAVYAYYNELTTTMDLEYKDTFEYTSGFDYFTKNTYYLWDDVNTTWELGGYMERTLNTQMVPEIAAGYEWDGTNYLQNFEEYYTYNTNGNPVHDSIFLFTNGTLDEDPIYLIHYYYEEYWDLGVDSKAPKAQISVYPNPATDMLSITSSRNEAMNLQLVNALGQTVKTARTGSAQGKLSIGDLTPGMYWLTVTDKAGNKLHQQAVVKQ